MLEAGISYAAISANNVTLMKKSSNTTISRNYVVMESDAGLLVVTINQHTHLPTYQSLFTTSDYLNDKELLNFLRSVKSGRVILVASYHDASTHLEKSSREILKSMGSWAVPFVNFRDCWVWAWVAGGPTLVEGLVPNMKLMQSLPQSLRITFGLTPSSDERFCPEWPLGELWDKRRVFCDMYDGYGSFCSCKDPFVPMETPKQTTWREDMAILILTATRGHYLYRLLSQVLQQPGVKKWQVLTAVDGKNEEVLRLLDCMGVHYVVHNPEGKKALGISRNLRFGLYAAVQHFNSTDKFIVLEDDLILTPDFYSFMQQTSVILEDEEEEVYAVSGYNHFAYTHTASNVTALRRVSSFPPYGWMTTRAVLKEILPKWLGPNIVNDWDYWLMSELVRGNREVVLPEVPRTIHGGLSGSHFSGYLTQRRFYNKPSSTDPDTIVDVHGARREVYENEILHLLHQAIPLNVTQPYDFPFPKDQGVYIVYILMRNIQDDVAFTIIGDALGTWNQDVCESHFGLWHTSYYNTTLFIMGVPYSRYSRNIWARKYHVFTPTKELNQRKLDNFDDDEFKIDGYNQNDYLKIMNLYDLAN
ncbi:protein O-linked-mannose beta-1,2-N-acetylglucosaminyltransferase 1-like [Oratosquilla oratoria]|uniref:protein O-linked-mannose beta-1,2-N-acetylglucosaminyltransferase 1-like n=1 Tax=Oratosquilla oratoria TaxID=337810 RepID=UPI003F764629